MAARTATNAEFDDILDSKGVARSAAAPGGGGAAETPMSAAELANVARHKRAYALFSAHDPAMFDLFADDVIEVQEPEPIVGKPALIELNRAFWGGFSDIRVDVDRAWGAGAHTFLAGRLRGTNDGLFAPMGLDHTGKAIDVGFVEVVRWRDGKAVRSVPLMDEAELARQLGQ
ncbi:MAG: ester cyclase [Deltaproteobacteria bacterium]|nr:ester cyclase [Deltaproteobacteria bacterium]